MLAAGGATVDHNSNKNIVPSTKRVMLAGTEHNSTTNLVCGLNKNNTQVPLLSNGQLSKLGDIREKHHGHQKSHSSTSLGAPAS